MSLNARRRRLNIVAPLDQSREQEIVGGLKNALDRGETLAKAKQSFINAGYKQEEVEAAVQKMPAMASPVGQQVQAPSTEIPATQPAQPGAAPVAQPAAVAQPGQPAPAAAAQPAAQALPTTGTTTKVPGQEKKLSKKFIIILVSIGVTVLIIAGVLGVFWNKIFG